MNLLRGLIPPGRCVPRARARNPAGSGSWFTLCKVWSSLLTQIHGPKSSDLTALPRSQVSASGPVSRKPSPHLPLPIPRAPPPCPIRVPSLATSWEYPPEHLQINFLLRRKAPESILALHPQARAECFSVRENNLALPLWGIFVIISLLQLN